MPWCLFWLFLPAGKSYDEKVDIFSFGIMLCEVSDLGELLALLAVKCLNYPLFLCMGSEAVVFNMEPSMVTITAFFSFTLKRILTTLLPLLNCFLSSDESSVYGLVWFMPYALFNN